MDMQSVNVRVSPGQLSPEAWAEMATRKIIHVSETAPQPIQEQAHVFRTRIEQVLAAYIRMAVEEDRKYTAAAIEPTNPEVAAFIRSR